MSSPGFPALLLIHVLNYRQYHIVCLYIQLERSWRDYSA